MSDERRSSVENRFESYRVLFRGEDRDTYSRKLLATACELRSSSMRTGTDRVFSAY